MRWKIELDGNKNGLEELSESFDEDPRIFEESGEYYLWFSEFEQLNKAGEVRDVGEKIIKGIRHLGKLDSLRVDELEWYCIIEIQEDGSERRIKPLSARATAGSRARARLSVGDEELPPIAESTYEYTQLALEDDVVQELIELLENRDRWVNLYRIYEHINDNIESEGDIVAQDWWTNTEKTRFTCTANDPDTIGQEARHAGDFDVSVEEMNHEQMSHAEAKSLIDSLSSNWLEHRKEVLQSSEIDTR